MALTIGDTVRFEATFKADEIDADPDTVILKLKNKASGIITYTYGEGDEIIKETTGKYYCDYVINNGGSWHYRWEGVGTVTVAEESTFQSEKSVFYQ